MSADTPIEWADHTFNPWQGCTKISDGCKNCYAAALDGRKLHDDVSHWGDASPRRIASPNTWAEPARWNRAAVEAGEPARVFCGSMCDVGEDRPDLVEPRRRLVDVIESTTALRWLLLSKRPHNFAHVFQWPRRMLRHVWFGTSVENQKAADERIPWLRGLPWPGCVRFLSVEPLLGPVRLELDAIDWVIVGGESGTSARPCGVEWIADVVEQCQRAGVAVFVKQIGKRPFGIGGATLRVKGKGGDPAEWPRGIGLHRVSLGDEHGNGAGDLLALRQFPRDPMLGAAVAS